MLKFLIVGSGFFGSVCARELTDAGHYCLVIDKRSHIAGNAFTETIDNIHIHKYGPHIFHTNNDTIWKWINRYITFNNYQLNPIANYDNKLYPLPFNMFTFNKIWGINTPDEAKQIIEKQKYNGPIRNLEDQALSLVGSDIYYKLIREYTIKQWGTDPKNLPASIIKRLPVRFSYNNNYFDDKYQGIPIGGYTELFNNLLDKISVELNNDFFDLSDDFKNSFDYVIYTGPIDRFFNYKYGKLNYRSLSWKTFILENTDNYQGCAIMNFTSLKQKHTRCIEHKFFDLQSNQKSTIISFEYPEQFDYNNEPFYPINDVNNNSIYDQYYQETKKFKKIIFGGRLAEFKYYDMHQIIGSALQKIKNYV